MKFYEWQVFLNQLAPQKFAWFDDNPGKQMGHNNKIIKKVLLCLDCNHTTIQKAIQTKVDLIISFHPFFWPNRRKNLKNDPEKTQECWQLKKAKIAVFSMHTNYENLYLGRFILNKISNQKIKSKNLINTTILKPHLSMKAIIAKCKKIFKIKYLDYWANNKLDQKIRKIVLVSGSGGHSLKLLKTIKADLLITGDLKWNHWQKIVKMKQNTIVVGHHMEEYFIESLKNKITKSNFAPQTQIIECYQGSILKKI